MKFFVAFVATLACAIASPSAYSAYAPAPYYGGYYGYSSYAHAAAPVTVLPSGYLADTPEVAHAKAAHLAEKAKVASYAAPAYAHGSYGYPAYGSYAGAYAYGPAQITVLPNGYLADTPEVSHAKAAHEVAKSHVAAAAAANPDYDSYSHGYAAPYAYAPYVAAPAYGYAAPAYGYAAPYSAYYAKPVVTPSGFLADTPEVAHAKAAHLAVKAAAAHSYHHY